MLGTAVFFEGGKSIELGKEFDGVTVVEIVSPWLLKLKHKTKLYDVAVGLKPSESIFLPLGSAMPPSGITVGGSTDRAGSGSGLSGAGATGAPAAAGATPAPAAPPATPNRRDPATRGSGAAPARDPAAAGAAPSPAGAPSAPEGSAPGAAGTLQAAPAVTPPPAPLTTGQIARMDRAAIRVALDAIATAKGLPNLDEATAQRLDTEQDLLMQRLEKLK